MPTAKEMMLNLLEGKEVEHDGEWCLVRDYQYMAGGETYDLRQFRIDELQFLIIWGAREPQ